MASFSLPSVFRLALPVRVHDPWMGMHIIIVGGMSAMITEGAVIRIPPSWRDLSMLDGTGGMGGTGQLSGPKTYRGGHAHAWPTNFFKKC